jgi:murein L,D-transpeptidase YcbB/YkuD
MLSRGLFAVVVISGALALTTGAAAAKTKAPVAEAPAKISYNFPVYDRVIDPVTAAIRANLAGAGTEGDFLAKRDAAGVAEYYAEQGYTPTWVIDGRLTEQAKKIIARLHEADLDGLKGTDYRTPVIGMGEGVPVDTQIAARAEVMLSMAIVTYARNAHSGRLDPASVSENFDYKPHLPDPVAVLTGLAAAADPAAALAAYNPTHPEFIALRNELATIRANATVRPPLVPEGKLLKVGMTDPRVTVLRQRLKVTEVAPDPAVFDAAVDTALKAFQEQAGLKADGILGKGTLGVLNADSDDHVATILANMERWRWMPEDLGKFYVRVNVPNFDLDIYQDGNVVFNTRIVVGQTDKQTPIFSDEIETAVVNPTWNIPASIAVKEMLPKLQAGQGALNGYQVFANFDGRFRPIDPTMVDWSSVDMRRIQIKQPPGERNALGSIKFLFPNPYAVYLHDTPSKSFFERDYRALSHGCMRVMNPWDFAAALLQHDPNVSVAHLRKLVGGKETAVNLTTHIPVHITYFTAWVDTAGDLQVRSDLYGHDREVEKGLGLI